MSIRLRPLRLPDDYAQIAQVLNEFWSEPTSAGKLLEADDKLYKVGQTWINDIGLLEGYDRERQVAVDERGDIVGYAWSWRAPWTEPGYVCNTVVVAGAYRKQGIGGMLVRHIAGWALQIGASSLVTEVRDDDPDSFGFAERRGFAVDRHSFQSVLDIPSFDERLGTDEIGRLKREGLRFLTLADEPGEENERKLYDMYVQTLVDIPGYMGDVPDIAEWRKWYLFTDGYQPELVVIAAERDRYVGVTHLLHNEKTSGMYHEYTAVSRDHRGRKIGLALKIIAARIAKHRGAPYIRTDNDSMNKPILAINRRLGYVPLRGHYRIIAPIDRIMEE